MILFCILFAIFGETVLSQSEFPGKQLTLTKDTSYVKFAPIHWNQKENGPQLIIPIRFRTRSIRGRLITITAQKNSETIFSVSSYVKNSAVIIEVVNGQNELLKRTARLLPEANDGNEKSMAIHLTPVEEQLKVVFGQGTEDTYSDIKGIFTDDEIEILITVGKYDDDKSVVGCVTLVTLSVGSYFEQEFAEIERGDGVLDRCKPLCFDHKCNKGVCVDLFYKAVCNCRGTLKSGEHCDEDAKSLNASWDQYIAYQITDKQSQPSLIAFQFKTVANEGVLLHGEVFSVNDNTLLGNLKLALIYGQIRLTIADFLEINFYNISRPSEKFHQVMIQFDYAKDTVLITVNDEKKSASWSSPDIERSIKFGNKLYFSNSIVEGGDIVDDREIGLSGCLREVYIDDFDLIDGYYHNSSEVVSSNLLKSCDENEDPVAVPLPPHAPEESIPDGNVLDVPEGNLFEYQQKQKIPQPYDENNAVDPEIVMSKIEEEMNDADDNKGVDVPAKKQPCENDEATFCKNSVECIKKGTTPTCICKKGFIGDFCQFSALPRNCDDVLISGNVGPGTYIIDVDGSGPLLETYVYCSDGETVVPHNMPNKTLMRSKDSGDLILRINYMLFPDEERLKALRENSEECSQTIRYECDTAPLEFSKNKTWFVTLGAKEFWQVTEDDVLCECKNGKCEACHCDGGGITSDEGIIKGENTPLTSIYALNDPTDGKGFITLSPLVCRGSVGRTEAFTATFRSRRDALPIGNWNGKSLAFEFRTYEKEVTLLSSDNRSIEIVLEGRHLLLTIGGSSITLAPQSRLNDGHWNKVIVDIIDKTVRFSVNDTANFLHVESAFFSEMPLFIGGGQHGFLGCIRQILVNGNLKNTSSLLEGYDGSISSGCSDKCYELDCKHESKCVHDFETDSPKCVCRNIVIHSGSLCENSINKDSEVSLHDLTRGFLKIFNPSTGDALKERIVLSVLTDRRDALLLYLHDHLYNFIQIHLSEHTRIVLTLNLNRTVHQCEVTARVGHEYSRMKWLQIMLFQREDRIQLNVDDEVCEIESGRILSEEFITKFEISNDLEDVVEPPVSPVKTEDNRPYALLFIGGVPTVNYKGTLDPTYKSPIPSLLGCVRGLMVGLDRINMRDSTYWTYYPEEKDAIRIGCETGCEDVEPTCQNDGHCTFKWMNTDPSAALATCDCSKTSYYGDQCDQDSGVHLSGETILEFKTKDILDNAIYDWSNIGENTLNFAFSAKVDSVRPQQIASIHFRNNRVMEIVLCKNGSLNVAILSPVNSYVYTFAFNYSDGYRHFFQSSFNGKYTLTVTVDSSKFIFPEEVVLGISLGNAILYYFGGIQEEELQYDIPIEGSSMKQNYSGCISGIDINLNVGKLHFKPILYLEQPEQKYASDLTVIGEKPAMGPCNAFKIPGTLPALQDNVNPPEWYSPFVTEKYYRPTVETSTIEAVPPESTSSFWWIILLVIILLLLIILLILLLLYCLKKRKAEQTPDNRDLERDPNDLANGRNPTEPELIPLMPEKQPPPLERPTNIRNNFDLPEPTRPLDRPIYNSPLQQKV